MCKHPIHIQPNLLIDLLDYQRNYYLFLDIDGTLSYFTINPKDSSIPYSTLSILQELQNEGINVVIVTGRSLDEAKKLLSPIKLPIAATHGLEIALNSGSDEFKNNEHRYTNTLSINTSELIKIKLSVLHSCAAYHDFFVEDKPYSVALHFRKNPTLANEAYSLMKTVLAPYPDWVLKSGKYVWEVVPKGVNKGSAILYLLDKLVDQADDNVCAIFIGDDIADEAGFEAIQVSEKMSKDSDQLPRGLGIKVGREPTCAHYYVNNIEEVTALLRSILSFCQTRGMSLFG